LGFGAGSKFRFFARPRRAGTESPLRREIWMDEKDRIYKKVNSIIREDGKRSSYIGEDDFVSLVKGGITINFHLKNPTLDMENIFRTVKRAQKIVKDRFDHDLQNLWIDIYSSLEEMRQEGRAQSRYASWVAGIYDGKVRVISEKEDGELEAIYILLTHEIIHLAVDELSSGKCPYWLDEGLAVYISQGLPDAYGDELFKAIKTDKTLPLETLEMPLPPATAPSIIQLAYAEAASLTEYLIESYGWDRVKSIVLQCRRRLIRTILSDLTLNYYLLEQGWKRWVREKKTA
jgi:hypothetical protein